MKEIVVTNHSGLFDKSFSFEVADNANWLVLDGKTAYINKESLTIDASFQVNAHYRDELGNKYDGSICIDGDIIDSNSEIEGLQFDFVEEDELF